MYNMYIRITIVQLYSITTKFSVRVSIASFASRQLYAKVLLKLVFTAQNKLSYHFLQRESASPRDGCGLN